MSTQTLTQAGPDAPEASSEETPTTTPAASEPLANQPIKKGSQFWLSIFAVMMSVFLSALDLTGVTTALPTIVKDLHGGNEFTWIGSAYALASTSVLPLTGCLADVFGRRPIMLCCIACFTLGSALAGAAQNMNMLIAARSKGSSIVFCVFPTDVVVSFVQPLRVLEGEAFSTFARSSFRTSYHSRNVGCIKVSLH